jgi:hypothetical protein
MIQPQMYLTSIKLLLRVYTLHSEMSSFSIYLLSITPKIERKLTEFFFFLGGGGGGGRVRIVDVTVTRNALGRSVLSTWHVSLYNKKRDSECFWF